MEQQNLSDMSDMTSTTKPFDIFVQVLIRPIVTIAAAYWLYRILLPEDHPLFISTVSRFFSSSVFQKISYLTYSVYLIHFRILF